MASVDINKLISTIKSALGKPYSYGASGPDKFDCSGLIYWTFKQCGVDIPRTSEAQYNACQKSSWSDVKPGDLLFKSNLDHVMMYIGNNQYIHSPNTGDVVKIGNVTDNTKSRYPYVGKLVDTTGTYIGGSGGSSSSSGDGGGGGGRVISTTTSWKTNPETDWLLDPSDDERRYGIGIYDGEQPLIKFSTYTGIADSGNCVEALKNYAEFLFYLLNAEMTTAQVTCVGMPWIRPGFNVWFDPIYSDTIYYCTDVQHQGNPQMGTMTSLTLILGRDRSTYSSNKDAFGSMKDNSDNVLMSESTEGCKTKDFGSCYDSNDSFENAKKAALNYYSSEQFDTMDAKDSEYHKSLYVENSDESKTPDGVNPDKIFTKSYTEQEIKTQLDNLYSKAPDVVKARANKLSQVMVNAEKYCDEYHILEKHTFG